MIARMIVSRWTKGASGWGQNVESRGPRALGRDGKNESGMRGAVERTRALRWAGAPRKNRAVSPHSVQLLVDDGNRQRRSQAHRAPPQLSQGQVRKSELQPTSSSHAE